MPDQNPLGPALDEARARADEWKKRYDEECKRVDNLVDQLAAAKADLERHQSHGSYVKVVDRLREVQEEKKRVEWDLDASRTDVLMLTGKLERLLAEHEQLRRRLGDR